MIPLGAKREQINYFSHDFNNPPPVSKQPSFTVHDEERDYYTEQKIITSESFDQPNKIYPKRTEFISGKSDINFSSGCDEYYQEPLMLVKACFCPWISIYSVAKTLSNKKIAFFCGCISASMILVNMTGQAYIRFVKYKFLSYGLMSGRDAFSLVSLAYAEFCVRIKMIL